MSDVQQDALPDAESPEPRLSIGHLLVGGSCIAAYMSIDRLLADAELSEQDALDIFIQAASGVFSGIALASLLLFICRRARHQRFPRSGGEILWLMQGIGVVWAPAVHFLIRAEYGWLFLLELLANLLVWAPIFAYAILTSRGRWRVYFLVHLLGSGVWYFACNFWYFTGSSLDSFHGIPVIHIIFPCRLMLETFALALVAWLDLRCSGRLYPWPHWAGIILDLSIGIVWSVYFAIYFHTHVLPLVT